MRLGAENRNKTIAAVVLGLLALLAFARMLSSFGGTPQASGPANNAAATNAALAAASGTNVSGNSGPRSSSTRRSRSQRDRRTGPAPAQSLDPRLNLALLEQSEKVVYSGTGRNIFKMEEEPPPIEKPVAAAEIQQKPPRTVPQGAAPPPPIPLKFYGWASKPGETRSVFLSANGSDIFVAREGEIIDRRYKIVRIQPNNVEVEDVLTNFHQTLPLTQG
jgi:hypothetical protein